jgi:hypothetical protein
VDLIAAISDDMALISWKEGGGAKERGRKIESREG